METLQIALIADSLKGLDENPLFSFLKNNQPELIQHNLTRKTFVLDGANPKVELSVFAETLASDISRKLNEDCFMVLPFGRGRILVAVLDGASSQKEISGLAPYGIKGSFYVSHLLESGFRDSVEYGQLSQQESLTAGDVMTAINGWIFKKMQAIPGVDYGDALAIPGMAASFLLFDANGEITMSHVSDTYAAVFYTDGRLEILTPNQNEKFDRKTMELIEKLARDYGCSLAQVQRIPEARAIVRAQIKESFLQKINKPGGCGILNGMPDLITNKLIFERKIKISEELSRVLLFSDGALLPYMESGISVESAVRNLADSLRDNQSNGSVLESGVARLESDPEFEAIPRHKHRDDATIIEISLNKQ